MGLSKDEELELAQLEKEFANKPKVQPQVQTSGLSPDEENELAQLEKEIGTKQVTPTQPIADAATQGRSFLQGIGQAGTFGYLPQVQAATRPISKFLYEAATGEDVPDKSYVQARDEYIKQGQALADKARTANLAGQVTGTVGTMLAPGAILGRLGKGAQVASEAKNIGLLGKAGRAAASGAATSAAYNPGDVEGEVNPLQLKERGKEALKGAAIGAGGELLTSGVARGLKAFSNKGKGLEKASNIAAVTAVGPTAGQLKKVYDKKQIDQLGQFIKDNDLVGGTKTVNDTLEKSSSMLDDAWKKMSEIYGKAKGESFNTNEIAKDINDKLTESLKGAGRGRQALNTVQQELENFKDLGESASFDKVFKFRKDLDDMINYDRTIADMPQAQKALKQVRDLIKERLDGAIEKISGEDLKQLKELNKVYGNASEIKKLASGAVARKENKMILGLPELIAGGAIGGAGAVKSANEGNPEDAMKSLGRGLLAGALFKAARTYGPGMSANALSGASRLVKKIPGGQTSGLLADQLGKMSPEAIGYLSNMLSKKQQLKEKQK